MRYQTGDKLLPDVVGTHFIVAHTSNDKTGCGGPLLQGLTFSIWFTCPLGMWF